MIFILIQNNWDGDGKVTTKEQAKGVENFEWMDMDGNGFVSTAELKKNLNFFGVYPTDEFIQGIFMEADINGDGQVNFEEAMASELRQLQLQLQFETRKTPGKLF